MLDIKSPTKGKPFESRCLCACVYRLLSLLPITIDSLHLLFFTGRASGIHKHVSNHHPFIQFDSKALSMRFCSFSFFGLFSIFLQLLLSLRVSPLLLLLLLLLQDPFSVSLSLSKAAILTLLLSFQQGAVTNGSESEREGNSKKCIFKQTNKQYQLFRARRQRSYRYYFAELHVCVRACVLLAFAHNHNNNNNNHKT